MTSIGESAILMAVVDSGVTVTQTGDTTGLALCPFHEEKTPSFSLHTDREEFYCFGCHKRGDVDEYRRLIAERRA